MWTLVEKTCKSGIKYSFTKQADKYHSENLKNCTMLANYPKFRHWYFT